MNILIHIGVGIAGTIIFNDMGFFIGSIIPDVVLIPNEIKLIKTKQKFNATKVPSSIKFLYKITHSLFFVFLCHYVFSSIFAWAVLLHQLLDWFTHEGEFSTIPFFPLFKININQIIDKLK